MITGSENKMSLICEVELECLGGVISIKPQAYADSYGIRQCIAVYSYSPKQVAVKINPAHVQAIGWDETDLLNVVASIQELNAYQELRELSKQELLDQVEQALFTHATKVQLDLGVEVTIEERCAYVNAISQAVSARS